MGGGDGSQFVGIHPIQVYMGVDEAGEDVFAGGVDIAVGGGQQMFGSDGGYLFANDGDGCGKDVRRSDKLAAGNDCVDSALVHKRLRLLGVGFVVVSASGGCEDVRLAGLGELGCEGMCGNADQRLPLL